ncbi:hypothetical protein INT46_009096 [Mucor plumbeus]|uniref:Uncharacterized protein n=1 Tax=Mucor plumbeus TaxID=97098 RepID=A0A8H7R1V7_9FUNG|nr:hypothetical protein INT46_009096 [Mucor plumbeus]
MYYTEIIYAKIQSVKYQRNSETISTCVGCCLVGYYNKNYYKCSKYNTDIADSDVNASKNMMPIASSIWNQDGRPTAFKRV